MSRAEEITSEVRRLVLTCRAMEVQLQQSIPKKTHQEVVSKMQTTIDGLNAEVERVKGEYQKVTTLDESISNLGSQIRSQTETITSLNGTITNQNQVVEAQRGAIEALSSRLSQNTVPTLLYDQTLAKVEELQEKVRTMVEKVDYASLQKKCDELTESLKSMVPREEYLALHTQFANFVPKESFEALQKTLSLYVPRDQLVSSEARVHELEAKLESYVPRSDYEELTAKITLLTKEASSLSVEVVPTVVTLASVEIPVAAPLNEFAQSVEPIATNPQAAPEEVLQVASAPVPETVALSPVVEAPSPAPSSDTASDVVEQIATEVTAPVETSGNASESPVQGPQETVVPNGVPAEASQVVADVPAELAVSQPPEQAESESSSQPTAVTPEITEIQSQLSEIKSAQDAGATSVQPTIVDSTMGFAFANTAFCAKSGLEFIQDLEQTPIETIQDHMKSGDFERWFKAALSDDASAESLKSIRESNVAGEELRNQIMAVIAPRYRN